MRFGAAKFLVMRRARLVGRFESPARISVAHRAYTAIDAVQFAARAQRRAGPQVQIAHWVERIGWPARRPARRVA